MKVAEVWRKRRKRRKRSGEMPRAAFPFPLSTESGEGEGKAARVQNQPALSYFLEEPIGQLSVWKEEAGRPSPLTRLISGLSAQA